MIAGKNYPSPVLDLLGLFGLGTPKTFVDSLKVGPGKEVINISQLRISGSGLNGTIIARVARHLDPI
jgi:hypothetical protein